MPKPTRRTFTAAYKLDILKRAALCEPGQLSALLQQEGLFFAQLKAWRAAADQGLAPKRRGPKPKPVDPNADEIADLRRRTRAMERQLKRDLVVIEIQRRCAALADSEGDAGLARDQLMAIVAECSQQIGVVAACEAAGVARATWYRVQSANGA